MFKNKNTPDHKNHMNRKFRLKYVDETRHYFIEEITKKN